MFLGKSACCSITGQLLMYVNTHNDSCIRRVLLSANYVQVAEYLLVTALFREGSKEEARRALEWLANPDRQFTERAVRQSSAHRGIQIHHAASGCAQLQDACTPHCGTCNQTLFRRSASARLCCRVRPMHASILYLLDLFGFSPFMNP